MSDDFSARYRLLKCVLVEDGIRTHNAQQLPDGRVVMVHIADAAGPDEVDALRSQLAELPTTERRKVLETATLPSGFAVVTEFLPPPLSFIGWLGAQQIDGSAPVTADDLSPVTPSAPPADPPALLPSAPVSEATVVAPPTGSFTMMFGQVGVAAPAPAASAALVIPPMTPAPATPAPAAAPGEFTMMFSPGPGIMDQASPVTAMAAPSADSLGAPASLPPTVPTVNRSAAAAAAAPSEEALSPFLTPFLTPLPVPDFGPPAQEAAPPIAPPVVVPLPPPQAVVTPPPAALPPSPVTAATSFGYDDLPHAPPAAHKPPGDFTLMFGAPETAAPMPESVRPSPMRQAPPPTFSPLTPERRLESPPVEPLHRVMSNTPNYAAGIQQDGPSPIAPNVVGGGQFYGLPPLTPRAPEPHYPPAHASPLFASERNQLAGQPAPPPGILPPPIFGTGSSTPLSALGGAAPLVNASAGPSDFTQLISRAAEPVVPALAPMVAANTGRASTSAKRRMPTGLIIVINAVLLIATLLLFFVLRRPVPTRAQLTPARPVMPNIPSAPKIPLPTPR